MAKKVVKKRAARKAGGSTLVNLILDKSGSMSSVQGATISGFNEYVQTLKKDGNNYEFSLTFFDTDVKQTYANEPIENVGDLTSENYLPGGNTALYDAACRTIDKVEKSARKDQKVITVIVTDGQENSSKEFTEKDLQDRIARLQKKGNWTFVFLGANQDSFANAQKMGISKMNTANFAATDKGTEMVFMTLSANTRSFAGAQASATSAFFSKADQDNLSQGTPQADISKHFSNLGKKSWEARQRKLLGE